MRHFTCPGVNARCCYCCCCSCVYHFCPNLNTGNPFEFTRTRRKFIDCRIKIERTNNIFNSFKDLKMRLNPGVNFTNLKGPSEIVLGQYVAISFTNIIVPSLTSKYNYELNPTFTLMLYALSHKDHRKSSCTKAARGMLMRLNPDRRQHWRRHKLDQTRDS